MSAGFLSFLLLALPAQPIPVLESGQVFGRWILDAMGEAVPPESFRRGLQTSGLFHRNDILWSVGDQRSQYPGHLFALDPVSGQLQGAPIAIEARGENPLFADYRSIGNPDFEGITLSPLSDDASVSLIGVIEDKRQWVVVIDLTANAGSLEIPRMARATAKVRTIHPLAFGTKVGSYRGDTNYRIEGVAISQTRGKAYLAYERLEDGLPRIFTLELNSLIDAPSKSLEPVELPLPFADVPPRKDKARARLNINGLTLVEQAGREKLIALARDQERLLVLDPEAQRIDRVVDLQFRAPDGEAMLWVSPEGLAADPTRNRLWIVNDPDSIRGNYRLLDDEKATGLFASYAPLLFELRLSDVLR